MGLPGYRRCPSSYVARAAIAIAPRSRGAAGEERWFDKGSEADGHGPKVKGKERGRVVEGKGWGRRLYLLRETGWR